MRRSLLPSLVFVTLATVLGGTLLPSSTRAAGEFVMTVKTDNPGSAGPQFTIPTTGGGYNYAVDCDNDGTPEATGRTGNYTCTYGTHGTYQIAITGSFPRFYFVAGVDRLKLLQVNQWGAIAWTSMAYAFADCANLTVTATDTPDLSGVTDLSYMFQNAAALTTNAAMGLWDTSTVTTMSDMFRGAANFNQDISGWDTSNVTNLQRMFRNATSFDQDIGAWDTGNVTTLSGMFQGAAAFNQDITGWDTSTVTNMQEVFWDAAAFDRDIGGWDVNQVTGMGNMLSNSGLSIDTFDGVLIGWASQIPLAASSLGASGLYYCEGAAARSALIADGLSITGAQLSCPAPVVTNVTASAADGAYKAGDAIGIQVTFDQAVTVSAGATLRLTLETGTVDRAVDYVSGSTTDTLTFTYTVQSGDTSGDLDYRTTTALAILSGTVRRTADGVTNAVLTLPAPGAAGSLGANKAIVIDGVVPAAPGAPDMTAGTDTGGSSTDNLTGDTTPDFAMTCEPGATVTLFRAGSEPLGTGACVAGTVTITAGTLADGPHSITARQTDATGNESAASGGLSVTIDATPPLVDTPDLTAGTDTGSSDTDDVTFDSTPTFTGACTTGDGLVTLVVDGVATAATGACTAGSFTITAAAMTEGAHTVAARQTDAAGNAGTSGTLDVIIDTAAAPPGTPDLTAATDTGSSSTDDLTNDATPDFAVSCETGAAVEIFRAGTILLGTGTCAGGTVTITAGALADGTHSIHSRQTDLAGNVAAELSALSVTVDTAAPAVTITAPAAAAVVGNPTTVTGACETGLAVSVGNANLAPDPTTGACAAGTYSVAVTWAPGTSGGQTLSVSQTDPAGNAGGPATVNVVLATTTGTPDLQAASDSGTSTTDDLTADATPTFDVTCTAGATVQIRSGITVLATGACTAGGTIALTSSALADGTFGVTAREDSGGGYGPDSSALSVTIDATADAAPGTPDLTAGSDTGSSSTDDTTSDTTPAFAVTCVSGSVVSLYDGATPLGSGTCAGGTVAITSGALADGSYTLSAKQTDPAGNESAGSAGLSVTVDTAAPAVTITAPAAAAVVGNPTTVTGACETGLAVSVGNANLAPDPTTGACAAGTYSVAVTWAPGTSGGQTLSVSQTDPAGNAGGPATVNVTVDLTTAAGTPDLQAASDSGLLSTDNVTNVIVPAFDAACTPGATVELRAGTTWLAAGTCPAGGTVALTSIALGDGTYAVTTREDSGGGFGADSPALLVTIDTTPPSPPAAAPDLQPGSDSGASATDDRTAVTTPAFDAECGEAGVTVRLYSDQPVAGTLVGQAVCAGAGIEGVTASALAEGTHAVSYTRTDVAGNATPAGPAGSVTVDTTAPAAVTFTAPLPTAGVDNGTAYTGTCEPSATVHIANTQLAGNPTATACSPGGTFSATLLWLNGTAGAQTVAANQTDLAGNTSLPATRAVTVHLLPVPTVTVGGGRVTTPTPVSGNCQPGTTVSVANAMLASTPVTAGCAGGTYALSVDWLPAADGTAQTLVVSQQDGFGGVSADVTSAVTVDLTPPALASAVANGATITLAYNELLDSGSVPAAGAFAVLRNGTPVPVTAVTVSTTTVRLGLASPAAAGDSLQVSYAVPGTSPVRDQVGLPAAAFAVAATNQTAVTPAAARATSAGDSGLRTTPQSPGGAAVPERPAAYSGKCLTPQPTATLRPGRTFRDTRPDDWFTRDVRLITGLGAMGARRDPGGRPTDFFDPNAPVTVAEVAKAILVAAGEVDPGSEPAGARWHEPYLARARALRLLDAAWQDPDGAITRADLTHQLATVGCLGPVTGSGAPFRDVSPDDPRHPAIVAAYQRQVVTGYLDGNGRETGYFSPAGLTTRGEFAAVLRRTIEAAPARRPPADPTPPVRGGRYALPPGTPRTRR